MLKKILISLFISFGFIFLNYSYATGEVVLQLGEGQNINSFDIDGNFIFYLNPNDGKIYKKGISENGTGNSIISNANKMDNRLTIYNGILYFIYTNGYLAKFNISTNSMLGFEDNKVINDYRIENNIIIMRDNINEKIYKKTIGVSNTTLIIDTIDLINVFEFDGHNIYYKKTHNGSGYIGIKDINESISFGNGGIFINENVGNFVLNKEKTKLFYTNNFILKTINLSNSQKTTIETLDKPMIPYFYSGNHIIYYNFLDGIYMKDLTITGINIKIDSYNTNSITKVYNNNLYYFNRNIWGLKKIQFDFSLIKPQTPPQPTSTPCSYVNMSKTKNEKYYKEFVKWYKGAFILALKSKDRANCQSAFSKICDIKEKNQSIKLCEYFIDGYINK